MELTAEARREQVLQKLIDAVEPLTASAMAREFSVSRQIIVGDVAILRAAGYDILATARGYCYEANEDSDFPYTELIACNHDADGMRDELYIIVDHGATVMDVRIEHPVYGELVGTLGLSSRYDVDKFIEQFDEIENAAPISALTGGTHLHHIGAKNKAIIDRVHKALKEKGFLME